MIIYYRRHTIMYFENIVRDLHIEVHTSIYVTHNAYEKCTLCDPYEYIFIVPFNVIGDWHTAVYGS